MDFVFAIVIAMAVVLGLPILAIAAFIRSGDAKRRLDAVELRLRQTETELGLIRAGLASGQPVSVAPVMLGVPGAPGAVVSTVTERLVLGVLTLPAPSVWVACSV